MLMLQDQENKEQSFKKNVLDPGGDTRNPFYDSDDTMEDNFTK